MYLMIIANFFSKRRGNSGRFLGFNVLGTLVSKNNNDI